MKKFLKTMKRILTEDLLFKIGSLLFAFLVWLAIVNINDPEMTKTISGIPIQLTDEEALTKQNMEITLIGNSVAQITVTGKRSRVTKLTKNDFVARAPLSEMSQVNAVPVYVEFKNSIYQNYVSIDQRTKTISVSVENRITKQYAVELNIEGEPFEGCEVGEHSIGRKEISITGPTSVLNLINKVYVNVDVSDATKDIEGKYDIKLYQADGKEIDTSRVVLSAKRTKVKIEILTKKKILVNYKLKGEPEEGYMITDTERSSSEVEVWGKEEDMKNLPDSINIPDSKFNVGGMIKTATFTVDLNQYLPKGVTVCDPEKRNFAVKVVIEQLITKRYELNKENIKYNNIPEGCLPALLSGKVKIDIVALEESHNQFDASKLTFYVDLSGAKAGVNDYKINVVLPDGFTQAEDVKVRVKLVKAEEETESEKESETESESESN